MALTFRDSDVNGTSSTAHEFGPFSIGTAAEDRRLIIGYVISGSLSAGTIKANGITASHVVSEVRSTNREGLYIVTVPEGETATITLDHGTAIIAGVCVWTATGMTSLTPLETEESPMTTSGTANEVMTTADNGIAVAVQFRRDGHPGWVGVTGRFDKNLGGFRFCGADRAPTEASSLTVGVAVKVNINSGWAASTWASGGDPGEGGGGDPGEGGDGDDDDIPGDGGTPTPGIGDRITDINAVFFRLDTDPPLRLWCGINDIPIELENVDVAGAVYMGAGRLLNVPDLEVLINGVADRVEFYLPGVSVENSNRVAAEAPDIQGAAVHVGLATLDDRYQPLTPITPVWYGLADLWAMKQPRSSDPSQPPSRTLVLSVGSGRTGRARARRAAYTDAQQKLLHPTDRFCERVARYTQLFDVEWPVFVWPLYVLGGALALSHWLPGGVV